MGFFGFLSVAGGVVGAIVLALGFASAKSAPQEAAIAALALALAVLPYVVFRTLQISMEATRQREFREAVLRRLETMAKP